MEKENKNNKPGVLDRAKAVIGQGIEAAKKSVEKLFTPMEDTQYKNEIIAVALTEKLATYYNGIESGVHDLEYSDKWEEGQFNVSAKLINLQSISPDKNIAQNEGVSPDIQEANLKAEVELVQQPNVYMPAPGIGGIDTMHASIIPLFNSEPVIHRIVLEITHSTNADGIIAGHIRDMVAKKYPHGRLIDRKIPLNITDESVSSDHLIAETEGSKKGYLRFIKFPIKKVLVENKVDDCLSVTNYDFQVEEPQELYTIQFPDKSDVLSALKGEKKKLHKQVIEFMGGTRNPFKRLFFSFGKHFRKVELLDNATATELSFTAEFDCTIGFTRSFTVSVEMIYGLEPVLLKKAEKAMVLRYLRHDFFVVRNIAK